jgi:hypothetical protein
MVVLIHFWPYITLDSRPVIFKWDKGNLSISGSRVRQKLLLLPNLALNLKTLATLFVQ